MKIWLPDGKLAKTLTLASVVGGVSFSADGKTLPVTDDQTVKTFETSAFAEITSFTGPQTSAYNAFFVPAGDRLVTTWFQGQVMVSDLRGGTKKQFLMQEKNPLRAAALSPDGLTLAACMPNFSVELFDLTGQSKRKLVGHTAEVKGMAFHPNGKLLATVGDDASTRLWNLDTGAQVLLLAGGDDWVMYTPDGLFDASKNGGRLVAMVDGVQAFGVDQFAAKSNRPDLILPRVAVQAAPRQYLYQTDRFIYADLNRRSGAIVFSSSRGGELSYESPAIENGYFTDALLAALGSKGADANGDGTLSSDELRAL